MTSLKAREFLSQKRLKRAFQGLPAGKKQRRLNPFKSSWFFARKILGRCGSSDPQVFFGQKVSRFQARQHLFSRESALSHRREGVVVVALFLLSLNFLVGEVALAKLERASGKARVQFRKSNLKKIKKKKSESFSIGVGLDHSANLADSRQPRLLNHLMTVTPGYRFNKSWALRSRLSFRTQTLNGQVPKGENQRASETFSPSLGVAVGHTSRFLMSQRHTWGNSLDYTSFLDDPSRLEGYLGLIRYRTGPSLSFADGLYNLGNSFTFSYLQNTFQTNASGAPNPDLSVAFSLSQSIRLIGPLRASLSFGAKNTRYLDESQLVSYQSVAGLSLSLGKFSADLYYENGGYTDQGRVDFWYLDEYRRFFGLDMGYQF